VRLEALLEEADRVGALSVPEMAGRIPTVERIALDLADVIDTAPFPARDPASLARVSERLVHIAARRDKAAGRPDIVLRVSLFGGVHALPPASAPGGYRRGRADAQCIDFKKGFVDSALGRIFRQTRSGRLVARVEELEASALRILRLPCFVDARLCEKSRDVRRQSELQAFNLRRIRDALAVALGDADVVRQNPHPLKDMFLVTPLEEADVTLRRVDHVLDVDKRRRRA
jgi:hypothetical protein